MSSAAPDPSVEHVGGASRAAAWLRDSALSSAAVLLVLLVAASGWSASFLSLHQFALGHMSLTSGQAWLVPGTFDGAAFGLSLLAFRAATYGRASFGSRLYVYGFTALSAWINYVHITDPRGRMVACLLPISAVVMFDKVLKEAREAFERRNGKQVFRIRPSLLVLRLVIDREQTARAIRSQITAIPVEALIGLGAGALARDAAAAIVPVEPEPAPEPEPVLVADAAEPFAEPEPASAPALSVPAQLSGLVDSVVDKGTDGVDRDAAPLPPALAPKFVPPTIRLETGEAAERIREGWANGWSVTETAAYATRDKAQVSRKFAELDGVSGRTVAYANGAGTPDY